jgi:periplasmic protein TonB
MTEDRTGRWLLAFLAVSAATHAGFFGGLGRRSHDPPVRRPPSLVTMEVLKHPPRPIPVPAPRAPPPRPVRRAVAVSRPAPAVAPPPAPAPPPVADFTGVTLTNDGAGAAWASATGDGRASSGPLGPALPPPRPAGPVVVGSSDLRRPPEAPPLDDVLARNYPQDERRQGITGTAVIRARILPDGQVQPLRVVSASRPAFADACRRTMVASRWSGPLDRQARPCATDISYTCRFELDR